MSIALSILQYLSIVTTGAMAILSLFFEFTKDDATGAAAGSRIFSRLTVPGKWAFAIICVSLFASLASSLVGENLAAHRSRAAAAENARLARELRLTTENFDTIALQLTFGQSVNWRDAAFLATERDEQLSGSFVKGNSVLASWLMTKDAQAPSRYSYNEWSMLYVETREDAINEALRQNPEFALGRRPDALEFVTTPEAEAPYRPPLALFFGEDASAERVTHLTFGVGSPQQQVRYDNQSGVRVTLHTRISYSDLIGSALSLDYRFHSSWTAHGDASIDGQPFEYTPNELPPMLRNLRSVDLLLNDQVVARAFDSANDRIVPILRSQQDFHDSVFTAPLLSEFAITRAMLIDHYEPRG